MTEAKAKTESKSEIKAQPMAPVSIDQDGSARLSWIVTVAAEFPYEALLEPRMWSNLAGRLNLRDRVEVWGEDFSWAAEFRVIDKGAYGVKVAEWGGKREFAVSVPQESIPAGYEVTYKGPMLRYCVIRKADGARIFEKGGEQAAAVNWLNRYVAAAK